MKAIVAGDLPLVAVSIKLNVFSVCCGCCGGVVGFIGNVFYTSLRTKRVAINECTSRQAPLIIIVIGNDLGDCGSGGVVLWALLLMCVCVCVLLCGCAIADGNVILIKALGRFCISTKMCL